MKVFVPHETVMPRRMVFCEVVSHVGGSFAPGELELFLSDAIADPVVFHVKCFGEFLSHLGVQDACSCRIVIEDGCALEWLWMSKFFKGDSHGTGSLGGEEDTTCFGFGSR